MKNLLKWLPCLLFAICSCAFVACNDDDDDDVRVPDPDEVAIDDATAVAGIYSGKLTSDDTTLSDAYIVRITKLTNRTVNMKADFLGNDNGFNFNVSKNGSQYILRSESVSQIAISVLGNSISINYTNSYGMLITYLGEKD